VRDAVAKAGGTRPLVLVDLWATWCDACKRERPRLDAIAAGLAGALDVVGVTIEPKDDAGAVARYRAEQHLDRPLVAFDPVLARDIETLFGGTPPLPSTLLVDRKSGAVVLQTRGMPTRSELERALWQRQP
jgi:thiol-disulfide isomerase/thioredoxin